MVGRRKILAALMFVGCVASDIDAPIDLRPLDRPYYQCFVEPVIAKRCAFLACHGDPARPYRIYALERLRLNAPADNGGVPLTQEESLSNYDISCAFAGTGKPGEPSLLLTKPLDSDVGGSFHRGKSLYGGGDVMASRSDLGYFIIANWSQQLATAPQNCTPIEDVGP